MARPKLYNRDFTDFSTGVDEQSSIFADADNPNSPQYGFKICQSADNVEMLPNGLEKMLGYANVLASAIGGNPVITGMYEYNKTGTSPATYFIMTAGTKVYTVSGSTVTQIYSGITADKRCDFVTYNNVCIITNGTDSPLYYDGTTCAAITFTDPSSIFGSAKPAFACVFRNRLLLSGDATYPHRIWTPAPGSHNNFDNTFSTVDAFDVSPGDGGVITMIKPYTKDLMIIYKTNSIHSLSGSQPFSSATDDPFMLMEVSRTVGCVAGRTVVQASQDHYFMSREGYKKLSAVIQYGDIELADPTFRIPDGITALNFTAADMANAFAVYVTDNDRYIYLHVPTGSGSTNTQTYVFNTMAGTIMPRSGITASCGAVVGGVYYTGTYDGQVQQHGNVENFNGAVIPSSWESKWLAIGGLNSKKLFENLMIYFETSGNASITVQWKVMKMDGTELVHSETDGNSSDDTWDTGLWDVATFDAGANLLFKHKRLGRGLALKIKITNNNANETWKIRKIEVGYRPLGKVAA